MKKMNSANSGRMLFVVWLGFAGAVFGGVAGCNSASFTSPMPIGLATGPAGSINDPNLGSTPGCTAVDDLFSAFSANTPVATFAAASATDTYGFTSTGTAGADPLQAGIDVVAPHLVSGAPGTGIEFTAPAAGAGLDAFSWRVDSHGATQDTAFSYAVQSSSAFTGLPGSSVLDYANLVVTTSHFAGAGSTVKVIENICTGTVAFSPACAGGSLYSITLSETVAGTFVGTVNFTAPVTEISVQTLIEITGGSTGAGSAALNSFTEEFGTPEPSTFILLGAGLAGVAGLQFRKRKQQS